MKVTSEERKVERLKEKVVSPHFNSCLNKVFNMQATCYQKLIILLLIEKIEDFKIIIPKINNYKQDNKN